MPPLKLQKTVMKKLKKWPFKEAAVDEKPAYKSVRDIFPEADTDTSIESDVTVIEIAAAPIPAARTIKANNEQPPVRPARTKHSDNKLKTAIDTFDRILDEYSAPKKEKPKLQKAKTCSIIESKCILKKHVARQEVAFKSLDESALGLKTTSLYNLDAELVDLSPFVVKSKGCKVKTNLDGVQFNNVKTRNVMKSNNITQLKQELNNEGSHGDFKDITRSDGSHNIRLSARLQEGLKNEEFSKDLNTNDNVIESLNDLVTNGNIIKTQKNSLSTNDNIIKTQKETSKYLETNSNMIKIQKETSKDSSINGNMIKIQKETSKDLATNGNMIKIEKGSCMDVAMNGNTLNTEIKSSKGKSSSNGNVIKIQIEQGLRNENKLNDSKDLNPISLNYTAKSDCIKEAKSSLETLEPIESTKEFSTNELQEQMNDLKSTTRKLRETLERTTSKLETIEKMQSDDKLITSEKLSKNRMILNTNQYMSKSDEKEHESYKSEKEFSETTVIQIKITKQQSKLGELNIAEKVISKQSNDVNLKPINYKCDNSLRCLKQLNNQSKLMPINSIANIDECDNSVGNTSNRNNLKQINIELTNSENKESNKTKPLNSTSRIAITRGKSNDAIARQNCLKPINNQNEIKSSNNIASDKSIERRKLIDSGHSEDNFKHVSSMTDDKSIIRRNCMKPINKQHAMSSTNNIAIKFNENRKDLKPVDLVQPKDKLKPINSTSSNKSNDAIVRRNCMKPLDKQNLENTKLTRHKSNDSITRRTAVKQNNIQHSDVGFKPTNSNMGSRKNSLQHINTEPTSDKSKLSSISNRNTLKTPTKLSIKKYNYNTQKSVESETINRSSGEKYSIEKQSSLNNSDGVVEDSAYHTFTLETTPVKSQIKQVQLKKQNHTTQKVDSAGSNFNDDSGYHTFTKQNAKPSNQVDHKSSKANQDISNNSSECNDDFAYHTFSKQNNRPSNQVYDKSHQNTSNNLSDSNHTFTKRNTVLKPPTSNQADNKCSTADQNHNNDAAYHKFTNSHGAIEAPAFHTSTPNLQKPASKVKTAIKRLNSLSTPDQQDRSIEIVIETTPKLRKPSSIPRASSYQDVRSAPKRQPTSRIPVSLNKSFPSTPSGLNLDRNSSAAQKLKKPTHARSMLNLKIERPRQRVPPKQLNDGTFGEAKGDFETKFGEKPAKKPSAVFKAVVRRTDTYTKPKTDEGKVSPDDKKRIFNASKSDSGIVLNEFGKDYSSDDNSDDSGNISNEADDLKVYSSAESLAVNQDENKTQIFFRAGVLSDLEAQRDERLAGMVVSLQAHCRGYLARRRLAHRKLQDLAVRCLQRNVRKFMLVRDWPWWRLLVRVTPLLNVHRTEEELRQKSEELELLKTKLERVETDRTTLKHENDKLEAKLSEMTADYAEEHSTSTLATERLDAETSERVRLERELSETQHKNKQLQQASERLEMELLYARSDLNGISEEDEDADGDSVYKQRYERAVRELEFTKRRLQQQHEDDLEQLVGLKKQLEKKLTDAYEEVEEQRQVVGQWKRKVQKVNGEMNDLKLLLEEQSARNNLLEKKQRKFDSETQLLQDELRQEKQAKERLGREKEVSIAEKFTLESNLADVKLDLEMKEEKLVALQRELDEVTYGGKTEEEVALLRKQKIECERRLHDQEEELDELAGQVQLLEQAKLKLEMNLEQMRKSSKKEAQQHDEELEEVRCSAQKKVKALEAQLENEHEERTILLREKHEIERRLVAALESDRNDKACDEAVLQRLKRDLKRTKALLRDTQAQLERQKAENPGKALIRQLRNQLEDVECARTVAVKAKQSLDAELSETQALLEDAQKMKNETEDRLNSVSRERSDMVTQLEENEEELAEVLKKYKQAVSQMGLDQLALQEQVALVSELEIERNALKEQLAELTTKLESVESMGDASSHLLVKRTELKVKELESKLDLEQTTKSRLDVQIARLKEAVDKLQADVATARGKEQVAQDQIRKLQRNLRELRDEHNNALTKEGEALLKRKELEKRCEGLESETATARTDLRLALKRIEDLQSAIQGELDDDSIDNSDSDHDSYSSDDSVSTFLANHKITSKPERTADGMRRLSTASRSSTSSNIGKDASYA